MVIRDPFGRWHSLLQLVLRLMRAARYSAGSANEILVGLHANTLSDSLSPSPYLARWRFYFCRRQRTQYAIFVACPVDASIALCRCWKLSSLWPVAQPSASRLTAKTWPESRMSCMISQASPALGNGIIAPDASMAFFAGFWRISSLAYLTSAMATPTLDTAEVTRFRQGANPIIAPRVL
ncbi:hypothetical protein BGZ61DRAFT_437726 [Ilyonectria robusta]|uniref:uncharacterized protein n=1 Tax=Ilyonectria robusta TaxID=1079257 RepID=UPI001E8E6A4C|nr:uncharacterized protein BGZ61DRAFT_437726 [Ilyonectria robusta]KAH8737137.1 hypothetical protein BGZ61DRAFT_437726 [Ilyonectria robusta]